MAFQAAPSHAVATAPVAPDPEGGGAAGAWHVVLQTRKREVWRHTKTCAHCAWNSGRGEGEEHRNPQGWTGAQGHTGRAALEVALAGEWLRGW